MLIFYTVQTVDYEATDIVLSFKPCEKQKCVDVVIFDDTVEEEPESFSYHLTRTPNLDPRIELDPAIGTVVIISEGEQLAPTNTTLECEFKCSGNSKVHIISLL